MVNYQGKIVIKIRTVVWINFPVKNFKSFSVSVMVTLSKISGPARLLVPEGDNPLLEFGFLSNPLLSFQVESKIGGKAMLSNIGKVNDFVLNKIKDKFQRNFVVPNGMCFRIPIPKVRKVKMMSLIKYRRKVEEGSLKSDYCLINSKKKDSENDQTQDSVKKVAPPLPKRFVSQKIENNNDNIKIEEKEMRKENSAPPPLPKKNYSSPLSSDNEFEEFSFIEDEKQEIDEVNDEEEQSQETYKIVSEDQDSNSIQQDDKENQEEKKVPPPLPKREETTKKEEKQQEVNQETINNDTPQKSSEEENSNNSSLQEKSDEKPVEEQNNLPPLPNKQAPPKLPPRSSTTVKPNQEETEEIEENNKYNNAPPPLPRKSENNNAPPLPSRNSKIVNTSFDQYDSNDYEYTEGEGEGEYTEGEGEYTEGEYNQQDNEENQNNSSSNELGIDQNLLNNFHQISQEKLDY